MKSFTLFWTNFKNKKNFLQMNLEIFFDWKKGLRVFLKNFKMILRKFKTTLSVMCGHFHVTASLKHWKTPRYTVHSLTLRYIFTVDHFLMVKIEDEHFEVHCKYKSSSYHLWLSYSKYLDPLLRPVSHWR